MRVERDPSSKAALALILAVSELQLAQRVAKRRESSRSDLDEEGLAMDATLVEEYARTYTTQLRKARGRTALK